MLYGNFKEVTRMDESSCINGVVMALKVIIMIDKYS